ncbi:Tenascin-R [Orchesella cincta]|uniref:Tenascin-R n=1 Tax=Orchesella cincta TaxID=48709 RepID=A0A1D2MJ57_ORCCI|nr:Tenascin-R [Orchesella cincta]
MCSIQCFIFLFCILNFTSAIPKPLDELPTTTQQNNKLVIPAMARKAGGNWKPELVAGSRMSGGQADNPDQQPEDDDSSSSYYDDEEEPECRRDEYYHVRGKQCVPIRCPGGNANRDSKTGECRDDWGVNNYGWRGNSYGMNRRPYVYRSTWWRHGRTTGFKRG